MQSNPHRLSGFEPFEDHRPLPKPLARKPIVHLSDGNTYFMIAAALPVLEKAYGIEGADIINNEARRHDYAHVWRTLARYVRLHLDVQAGTRQWAEHGHHAEAFYDSGKPHHTMMPRDH